MRLYIVPGAPTLFYQQGNHNSCIISYLESALHYMGDEYASKYIIKRMHKYLLEIHNKGRMHFCRDILMGHHREKTVYDVFLNQPTYTTVCLLPETWHRTDNFITVFGKWIFDSNLKVALPLTQVCLNYIYCGNDTDDNKFIGVLHAIREVPMKFFKED